MERLDVRKSFYAAVCEAAQPDPSYTRTKDEFKAAAEALTESVGNALAALVARVGTVLLHFDEAHYLTLTAGKVTFGIGVGGLMSYQAGIACTRSGKAIFVRRKALSALRGDPRRPPSATLHNPLLQSVRAQADWCRPTVPFPSSHDGDRKEARSPSVGFLLEDSRRRLYQTFQVGSVHP
jgi:hypothetical protein